MVLVNGDLPAGYPQLPSSQAKEPRGATPKPGHQRSGVTRQQITGQRGSKRGTPGTAAAAVRFDIQGWLIYGAGETVPLHWVFMRRRSWQFSPYLLHHKTEVTRCQTHIALTCNITTRAVRVLSWLSDDYNTCVIGFSAKGHLTAT